MLGNQRAFLMVNIGFVWKNSLFLFTILFLGEIYCSIFGRVFLGDKENESGNLEGKLCPQ
jgi:hypothetical protein